jgi:hypothetical protein
LSYRENLREGVSGTPDASPRRREAKVGPRVLALLENSIGVKLLLLTRLKTLGYQATIMSSPAAFRERVAAEAFDWIILDGAALPSVRRRFLDHLQRHRGEARIVWCGKPPRRTRVPLETIFEKPLRYDEIERFFSRWTPPDSDSARTSGPEIQWKPVGKRKEALHDGGWQGRGAGTDIRSGSGTSEGDDKQ